MPRSAERKRVERGLYRAGDVYIAAACPPGSRRPRWKTLGPVGLMEARRLRAEFVVDVRRGNLPRVSRRATVRDVAARWLAEQERLREIDELSPRTFESYEAAIRLHLGSLAGRQAAAVTAEDLIEWQREQRAKGAAANSIRAWWIAVRGALAYAARHGYAIANPADQLTRRERPKGGDARKRFLSREEMTSLLDSAPERYRVAIATGLFAGLRISEVLGLAWEDIDREQGQLRVRFQMSRGKNPRRRRLKSGAGARDVVLMPALASLLRDHRLASPWSADSDLIFATASGRTIGSRNLAGRGLEKACETARLRGVTFHVLRHTFASLLIAQGRDPAFVAAQLGHDDPGFTLRTYVHLFDAARHAQEARDQLEADYGSLLRGAR